MKGKFITKYLMWFWNIILLKDNDVNAYLKNNFHILFIKNMFSNASKAFLLG